MNRFIELQRLGWGIKLKTHPQYIWLCELIPNHMNYSWAPSGADSTPEIALAMAEKQAQEKGVKLQ